MPKVRLDLTDKTFEALTALAVRERRPIDWQAEVLIESGLGVLGRRPDAPVGDDGGDSVPNPHGTEAVLNAA